VCSYGGTQESVKVPFSLQISLPSGLTGMLALSSITSPGASWAGAPTNAGSIDLLSLGFGPDSLYGGDLTVSGFLQLTGPAAFPAVNNTSGSFSSIYREEFYTGSSIFGFIPTGSSNAILEQYTDNSLGTGFNADTNFDLQYSVTDSEGGTLTLVSTPEPATVLLSGVLAALALLRRLRMRRVEASDRR